MGGRVCGQPRLVGGSGLKATASRAMRVPGLKAGASTWYNLAMGGTVKGKAEGLDVDSGRRGDTLAGARLDRA